MADPRVDPYDRKQLYQEVWEAPVRDVAKRYGVSDVYLARICRALSVPLPGRGYWAKPVSSQTAIKREQSGTSMVRCICRPVPDREKPACCSGAH